LDNMAKTKKEVKKEVLGEVITDIVYKLREDGLYDKLYLDKTGAIVKQEVVKED